jgi:hypothetical protein
MMMVMILTSKTEGVEVVRCRSGTTIHGNASTPQKTVKSYAHLKSSLRRVVIVLIQGYLQDKQFHKAPLTGTFDSRLSKCVVKMIWGFGFTANNTLL